MIIASVGQRPHLLQVKNLLFGLWGNISPMTEAPQHSLTLLLLVMVRLLHECLPETSQTHKKSEY